MNKIYLNGPVRGFFLVTINFVLFDTPQASMYSVSKMIVGIN